MGGKPNLTSPPEGGGLIIPFPKGRPTLVWLKGEASGVERAEKILPASPVQKARLNGW
jgi:hypothetical protein